jgi:hypothetical protein
MNFEPGNDPGSEIVSVNNLLFGFNYHFYLISKYGAIKMDELQISEILSQLSYKSKVI